MDKYNCYEVSRYPADMFDDNAIFIGDTWQDFGEIKWDCEESDSLTKFEEYKTVEYHYISFIIDVIKYLKIGKLEFYKCDNPDWSWHNLKKNYMYFTRSELTDLVDLIPKIKEHGIIYPAQLTIFLKGMFRNVVWAKFKNKKKKFSFEFNERFYIFIRGYISETMIKEIAHKHNLYVDSGWENYLKKRQQDL